MFLGCSQLMGGSFSGRFLVEGHLREVVKAESSVEVFGRWAFWFAGGFWLESESGMMASFRGRFG